MKRRRITVHPTRGQVGTDDWGVGRFGVWGFMIVGRRILVCELLHALCMRICFGSFWGGGECG